jgi:hypothetical protein
MQCSPKKRRPTSCGCQVDGKIENWGSWSFKGRLREAERKVGGK